MKEKRSPAGTGIQVAEEKARLWNYIQSIIRLVALRYSSQWTIELAGYHYY